MPSPRCLRCPAPSSLRRPRTGETLCRRCFVAAFEDEAHRAVAAAAPSPSSPRPPSAPKSGETVAVAASGGKDSTVLAHLLSRLDRRHGYGYRLMLLAVDEGIAGYREASLRAVRRGRGALPLLVVSHRDLFGWSVDEVGAGLGGGSRCTFCGVFRRQALERGARALGVDWIATGHNADDIAETVLMNFLRGDVARLRRAATEATGTPGTPAGATMAPGEATEATTSPAGTSKSSGTTENPTEATKNPMGTTKNPVETTRSSMKVPVGSMTTENPMETTKNPMGTTTSSVETTMSSTKVSEDSVTTTSFTGTTKTPPEAATKPMETTTSSMNIPGGSVTTKNFMETSASPMETTTKPMETTTSSMNIPTDSVTTKSSTATTKNPPETTTSSMETTKKIPKTTARHPKATKDPAANQQVPVATPWPAVPRCKPLRHAYEKEIVLYAYFEGLDYVSTECVYAPHAYRGHARNLLKDLEATRPSTVAALGHSGRRLAVATEVATKTLGACGRCGFAASQPLCKACVLLASLERGLPRLGLGKRSLELASGSGGYRDDGGEGGGHGDDGRGVGGQRDDGHGVGGRGDGGHGVGGYWDGGHGVGGYGDGGQWDDGHGVGGHRDDGHGVGGQQDDGHGVGGCGAGGCGLGGQLDDGHGDGGRGDGDHGGCCHGAGGHRVCSYRVGGHGAGGHEGTLELGEDVGGGTRHHGELGQRKTVPRDGHCWASRCCGGGHGVGGHRGTRGPGQAGLGGPRSYGASDHGEVEPGAEAPPVGGHGASDHQSDDQEVGDHQSGGPTNPGHVLGGRYGDVGREGVEVEVVGAGGRTVRQRVLGFGRVRGALNIWDF